MVGVRACIRISSLLSEGGYAIAVPENSEPPARVTVQQAENVAMTFRVDRRTAKADVFD